MTAVWPDCSAATTPGATVRDQLDYLVWISEAIEPVGFHATDELERWRPRVDRAYQALIDAMVPGHGDPLPPDVPPSVRPGTWPDVPAATIPGMTVRHQLTVIRTVALASRANRAFPHLPPDVAAWASRVQAAYDALDHGPALAMPVEARTQPPPPPPPRKRGPAARLSVRGKAAKAGKPAKTGRAAKTGKVAKAAKHARPTTSGKRAKAPKSAATARKRGAAKRKAGPPSRPKTPARKGAATRKAAKPKKTRR